MVDREEKKMGFLAVGIEMPATKAFPTGEAHAGSTRVLTIRAFPKIGPKDGTEDGFHVDTVLNMPAVREDKRQRM